VAREAAPVTLGLYARAATPAQPTLARPRAAMRASAHPRRGAMVLTLEAIGAGGRRRRQRDARRRAARRRDIEAIVVWRLERWGRA
jgi:putative DNA-invertase from lambdoid prophage Rac